MDTRGEEGSGCCPFGDVEGAGREVALALCGGGKGLEGGSGASVGDGGEGHWFWRDRRAGRGRDCWA